MRMTVSAPFRANTAGAVPAVAILTVLDVLAPFRLF
jgi:hypothetical protein